MQFQSLIRKLKYKNNIFKNLIQYAFPEWSLLHTAEQKMK